MKRDSAVNNRGGSSSQYPVSPMAKVLLEGSHPVLASLLLTLFFFLCVLFFFFFLKKNYTAVRCSTKSDIERMGKNQILDCSKAINDYFHDQLISQFL